MLTELDSSGELANLDVDAGSPVCQLHNPHFPFVKSSALPPLHITHFPKRQPRYSSPFTKTHSHNPPKDDKMSGNGYTYKGHGTNNQVDPHTPPPPQPLPNPTQLTPSPSSPGQPLLRPGLRLQRLQLQHVPLLQHVRPLLPQVVLTEVDEMAVPATARTTTRTPTAARTTTTAPAGRRTRLRAVGTAPSARAPVPARRGRGKSKWSRRIDMTRVKVEGGKSVASCSEMGDF